jgi:hypothetical protein
MWFKLYIAFQSVLRLRSQVVVIDLIVISGGVSSSTASVMRLSLQQQKSIGRLISGSLESADLQRMSFNDMSIHCHGM